MGDIHYFVEMPVDQYRYDQHVLIVTPDLFRRIGDYTQSKPTSPSPGRIYKKNLHWTGPPSNWWVYLCEPSTEEGYVDHRPLRLVTCDHFGRMINKYTPMMPPQIGKRVLSMYRYVWDGRERRWMRSINFPAPGERRYRDEHRVDPRNHLVGECNKPVREADLRALQKEVKRIRKRFAREHAWRSRPMTHHESFERQLVEETA